MTTDWVSDWRLMEGARGWSSVSFLFSLSYQAKLVRWCPIVRLRSLLARSLSLSLKSARAASWASSKLRITYYLLTTPASYQCAVPSRKNPCLHHDNVLSGASSFATRNQSIPGIAIITCCGSRRWNLLETSTIKDKKQKIETTQQGKTLQWLWR